MKQYLLIIVLGFGFLHSRAQLDNTSFDQFQPIVAKDSNALNLGINILGFNKNNEYFNDIADGFTLFGYQFNPYFTYQAGKHFKLSGGVYLQKDFGNDDFSEVAPTFTASYNFLHGRILFGTLEGSTSHRLVEPLYDFERVLIDRLENGFQFKMEKQGLFLDLWVDWQNMIYRGDNDQEEVTAGLSFNKRLTDHSWQVELPVQMVVFHRGGQIDSSPLSLQTHFNSAIGGVLTRNFINTGFVRSFRMEGYFMYHNDFSDSLELAFENGSGTYLNASVKTKIHLDIMASYWRGTDLVSFMGGQLYQSVSHPLREPVVIEPERQLLIFRFLHNLKISDNIFVSARFEPYYDIENGLFGFSHGLYINYRPQFFITRVKDHQ